VFFFFAVREKMMTMMTKHGNHSHNGEMANHATNKRWPPQAETKSAYHV